MGEIDFGDLQFDNLEAVTLSRANLTSLKNFPSFPSLVKVRLTAGILSNIFIVKYFQLDLCHNRLSKGLENLKDCTKLKCLLLTGNRFKPTKELEFLLPLVRYFHRKYCFTFSFPSFRRPYQASLTSSWGRNFSMTTMRNSALTR